MHRRKDVYGEDPMHFVPERWQDAELAKQVGYGYLPFNGGPRLCLGAGLRLARSGLHYHYDHPEVPENDLTEECREDCGRQREANIDARSRSKRRLSGTTACKLLKLSTLLSKEQKSRSYK